MPAIKRLTLENFGPHRKASFDFDEGIVLIRGPNRSGKTWLLRALDMVLYNRGRFNECVTKGENYFRITLTLSDGTVIERYRDKSTNKYVINGEEYTAIGQGFFEPVGKATGIFPVSLDGKNEYCPNIRLPIDPPYFIIGEPETRQSAILMRLVGLDVADAAESSVRKDIRAIQTKKRELESTIGELERNIEQLEGVDECLKLMEKADEYLRSSQALAHSATKGKQLLEQRKAIAEVIAETTKQLDDISTLLTELASNKEEISTTQDRVAKAQALLSEKQTLIEKIKKGKELLNNIQEKIKELSKKRIAILKEAGRCPLCGQEVK